MSAWVAAIVGGAIAFAGQHLARHREKKMRIGDLLLEHCAQVVALSDDFRNRLWEDKEHGHVGRVRLRGGGLS